MAGKKGQIELAVIKGLALAFVIVMGFFAYDKIKGETNDGEPIECQWKCENVGWSPCIEGFSYSNVGSCNSIEDCKCIPNDPDCFNSNAKPEKVKACE